MIKKINPFTLCVIIFLVFSSLTLNYQVIKSDTPYFEPDKERRFKFDPKIFKIFSLGQLHTWVDYWWLQVLLNQDTKKIEKNEYSQLYYDLDLITDLDEEFFNAYMVGGNLLSVVRKDKLGAKDLLLKGKIFIEKNLENYSSEFKNKYWGKRWNLYTLLAYHYLFELDDMTQAAHAFKLAAIQPHAPAYLERLSKRLNQEGGEYEVGLKLLDFMILGAEKIPNLKEKLEQKKVNLYISQILFNANQEFLNYLENLPKKLSIKNIKFEDLQTHWNNYIQKNKISIRDPWGGNLFLNRNGKITTTTRHESVFGLE